MTNKRTVETMIAHNVNKGLRADRTAINNTRAARAIITSECATVGAMVRRHGAEAVFKLRSGLIVCVRSVTARKGRPTLDAKQHGFGSSTVVTFSSRYAKGKVSKVIKTATLAEFCNMGAKYLGTAVNVFG